MRAFGRLYRQILAESQRLRPQAVIQICSCGTPLTFDLIPATTQTVTADPTSSYQVRQRIKFYKALMGPQAAVFADHVELTDGGMDFASQIGVGGVPGTKDVHEQHSDLTACDRWAVINLFNGRILFCSGQIQGTRGSFCRVAGHSAHSISCNADSQLHHFQMTGTDWHQCAYLAARLLGWCIWNFSDSAVFSYYPPRLGGCGPCRWRLASSNILARLSPIGQTCLGGSGDFYLPGCLE